MCHIVILIAQLLIFVHFAAGDRTPKKYGLPYRNGIWYVMNAFRNLGDGFCTFREAAETIAEQYKEVSK